MMIILDLDPMSSLPSLIHRHNAMRDLQCGWNAAAQSTSRTFQPNLYSLLKRELSVLTRTSILSKLHNRTVIISGTFSSLYLNRPHLFLIDGDAPLPDKNTSLSTFFASRCSQCGNVVCFCPSLHSTTIRAHGNIRLLLQLVEELVCQPVRVQQKAVDTLLSQLLMLEHLV